MTVVNLRDLSSDELKALRQRITEEMHRRRVIASHAEVTRAAVLLGISPTHQLHDVHVWLHYGGGGHAFDDFAQHQGRMNDMEPSR